MKHRSVAILAMAMTGVSHAGDEAISETKKADVPVVEERDFCDFVNFPGTPIYSNPDNPFLQTLAFTGRLQADWAVFDGDELGDYDRLLWRRARAGFKAKVFQNFTLHAEADLDFSDEDIDYNGLTDAYVAWSPNSSLKIKVGKQSAGFTLDGATSSKKLLTTERSNVANNFWFTREYFTGLSVGGDVAGWDYKAGVFAGDEDPEFGLDQGHFFLLSLGRDFSDCVSAEKAAFRLDYVYNDADLDDFGATRSLEHVVSLSSMWESNDWGVWTDLSYGSGLESRGQSDLFGLQIMPFYNFTEKFQGVLRYTYVRSDEDNGVRLNRYENRIESGRGDEYNEFYLGLNYFICDHRLKLQTGLVYTDMNDDANDGGDYDGWGWTTGVRYYW